MKKTGFNLVRKIWCTILLSSGIFMGCDLLNSDREEMADIDGDGIIDGIYPSGPSNLTIRPYKIDMADVQGFAIADNMYNSPRTKADTNGDGIDDDMPNGTEVVNTSPYALYTIDKTGKLHISIFYFEIEESGNCSTDNDYTEVLKEVSNALQIVPSLVTDLGKYILFSGCKYQIIATNISNEALSVCQAYINENARWDMTYIIRKSDGGLFDITADQSLFCYSALLYESYGLFSYYPENAKGVHIQADTYITSAKENLFVMSLHPNVISKFEDDGNAIDVKQMTQIYGQDHIPAIEEFSVDEDENIYLFNGATNRQDAALHVYYANGGFNAYEVEPNLSNIENYALSVLDFKTDVSGDSYVFLISGCHRAVKHSNPDGYTYNIYDVGLLVMSARVNNGTIEPICEHFFPTQDSFSQIANDNTKNYYYLGYYNNCFKWCLRYNYDNQILAPYMIILSYDTTTNTYALKPVSAAVNQLLLAKYDSVTYGRKIYCANVKGNSIDVTEIDLASETYSTYSLSVDMPTIVLPTYITYMIQDVPYMIIEGRNTINGAGVSITVNLINGDSNSTFAQDGRNVVSFFRIN